MGQQKEGEVCFLEGAGFTKWVQNFQSFSFYRTRWNRNNENCQRNVYQTFEKGEK